jgi:hypothetical protein
MPPWLIPELAIEGLESQNLNDTTTYFGNQKGVIKLDSIINIYHLLR